MKHEYNLVAITKALLDKKGRPGFFTRRGMKKAVLRGVKLRRANKLFRYVLVPHPTCAKKEQVQQLLDVLTKLDPEYLDIFITPDLGVSVPTNTHKEFVRQRATSASAKVFIY